MASVWNVFRARIFPRRIIWYGIRAGNKIGDMRWCHCCMNILIFPHGLIRTAGPRPRIYQITVRILNLKMKMGPIRKSRATYKGQCITSLDGVTKRDLHRILFKVPIESLSIIRMSNYCGVTHCPIGPFQSPIEFSIVSINDNTICSG